MGEDTTKHIKSEIINNSLILVGVISASIGLKGFLLPSNFLDGGVTGIALMTNLLSGINISLLILLINIPFIILAYKQISKTFALKTLIAISLLALLIRFVEIPIVTNDKLLISIFGGIFLGAGIGLSIRGGSVIDGTEVLALYLNKKTGLTVGDIILIFNVFIFGVAAYLINIETAMYAILTYFTASKTVDFLLHGIEEYTALSIVSIHHREIRMMIINDMGRGVTIYKGKSGFNADDANTPEINILYTVVTRLEVSRIKTKIAKIDPNAFIVQHVVDDARGGMIKKRKTFGI